MYSTCSLMYCIRLRGIHVVLISIPLSPGLKLPVYLNQNDSILSTQRQIIVRKLF